MGLISFIREAGEKLFGSGSAQAASPAEDPNAVAAKAITDYIAAMNLSAKDLQVSFDGASGTATVSGEAPDQPTREKIVLCCGNVAGVDRVEDRMTVAAGGEEAQYYTVVKGDTLSKIAKQYYGNANQYMPIFEANKPMLTHPDKIYPGQVLRIPPQQK
ncbi:MAG TPA: peptidoglycan-binding protein LysM [Burkholderiaceae bacterium]|nr:peptidoglycan-binding protein LysM [Burkholderiaceae bacterium]